MFAGVEILIMMFSKVTFKLFSIVRDFSAQVWKSLSISEREIYEYVKILSI